MKIESFITKEQVVYTKSTEKQLVIKELLNRLEELKKIDDAGRFYAQIMHRESLENTGIGRGLAIPHIRTDSVKELVSIFGISREGIEYHSLDNMPVRYLLLNIVPTEMGTKYLYLVGMMSWIFTDEARKKDMDGAKTKVQAFSALKKNAELYFTTLTDKSSQKMTTSHGLGGIPLYNLDLLVRLDRLNHLVDEGETSDKIMNKIEELRKIVDRKSLAYYEKMRKKNLSPFAILEKKSCSGCHMDLAPYYLAKIKESKDIAVCNHCGRFLIVI
ncbi:MAG: PTS sugar transporter subunit IIA [Spirochaetes bacterium]|nr:PTS sugar transporter subunit IIA [Spirochaetota bacterium]